MKTKKKSSKKKEKNVVKKETKFHTLNIKNEEDIARDFSVKVYQKFDKVVKSIILFGSVAKKKVVSGSDIDIIIIIDDVSVSWDQEHIAWYREELGKIVNLNPYNKEIHINTIKLSTWWEDLLRGDPVVLNIVRYGEAMIDFGGFFEPIKYLLIKGKIRATPEAISSLLQRAPTHFLRSKVAELNSIEGLYWAMVDSSHAALIAAGIMPPSPEDIAYKLGETFVSPGKLKSKYVDWYKDLHMLHKKIAHGDITDLKGVEIDSWQERTEEFMSVMTKLVKEIIESKI